MLGYFPPAWVTPANSLINTHNAVPSLPCTSRQHDLLSRFAPPKTKYPLVKRQGFARLGKGYILSVFPGPSRKKKKGYP